MSSFYTIRRSFVSLALAFLCSPAGLVNSLHFLLRKTDICKSDIANIQVALAGPAVKSKGASYERENFFKTFGESGESAEGVRDWCKRIRGSSASKEPAWSAAMVEEQVKTEGFIDQLLFSSVKGNLPEIFNLDVSLLAEAREVFKIATIGASLSIHITNAAKVPLDSLDMEPLLGLLASRRVIASDVLSCALRTGGLNAKDARSEYLKGRIAACFDATDKVANLMDVRVRRFFKAVVRKDMLQAAREGVPSSLKSGRTLTSETAGAEDAAIEAESKLIKIVLEEANKAGLGLFARYLSDVTVRLIAVLNHAWDVYGDALLKPLLQGA